MSSKGVSWGGMEARGRRNVRRDSEEQMFKAEWNEW